MKKALALLLALSMLLAVAPTAIFAYDFSEDAINAANAELQSPDNLAYGKTVLHPDNALNQGAGADWTPSNLTDGKINLNGGRSETVGYHSNHPNSKNHEEWVAVDLGGAVSFDTLVIYPSQPSTDENATCPGFPNAFRVQVSDNNEDWTTLTIAVDRDGFGAKEAAKTIYNFDPPKGEPVTINFPAVTARYVKFVGYSLNYDGNGFYLKLSELAVYNTGYVPEAYTYFENVAANKPITITPDGGAHEDNTSNWHLTNLNNGDRYDMVTFTGNNDYGQFAGFHSAVGLGAGSDITIDIDLGNGTKLNQVVIYPSTEKFSGTRNSTSFYFPDNFTIEVSNDGENWTAMIERTGYSVTTYAPQVFDFTEVVTAAYLRFAMKSIPGFIKLSELEAFDTTQPLSSADSQDETPEALIIPNVNLAPNKDVIANGVINAGNWQTTNINNGTIENDGGFTTSSGGVNTGLFAGYDLGQVTRVNSVVLYSSYSSSDADENWAGIPKSFKVQVSDDNLDWTTVASFTNESVPEYLIGYTYSFDAVDTRYIRVLASENYQKGSDNNNSYIQIAEMEVWYLVGDTKITLDGQLEDWAGLDALTLVGKDETSDKSVTFYGYRSAEGLYLACEAVHKTLITDRGNWWENNNFEIFLWNNDIERSQYWVRTGLEGDKVVPVKSGNIDAASLTCVKNGEHYTTKIELFISNRNIPANQRSAEYLPLGCAYKINGGDGRYEDIKGGGANEYDSYWVLPYCWPAMCSLIATNTGLYTGYDHWEIDGGSFRNTGRVRWPNFTTYMLGQSEDAVTLSAEFTISKTNKEPENNGGDYGFFFAVKDNNGDGIIQEGGDLYLMVDIQANGVIGIERNNGGWGGWAQTYDTGLKYGDTVRVTATYDHGHLTVFLNDDTVPVIDYTDPEPLAGTGYALSSKVTNALFKDVKVNGVTPAIPDQAIPASDSIPTISYEFLPEADEASAQTNRLGQIVLWADHNWNGSDLSVYRRYITSDGTAIVSFTHTGKCSYGAQLFYNPEGAVNGQIYNVSFTVTSTVDTVITAGGVSYELTANVPRSISYTVRLDMQPSSTEGFGTSLINIQLGDKNDENADVKDGTYTLKIDSAELVPTDENLDLSSVSLTLQSSLAFNFKSNGDFGAYSGVYALVCMNGSEYRIDSYNTEDDLKVFSFRNIAPDKMGDTISVTLIGEKANGDTFAGDTVEISVADYCGMLLDAYAGNDGIETLVADLLNYGSEAQKYTGYKTDALVNGTLTGEQLAKASTELEELEDDYATIKSVDGAPVQITGVSLVLRDSIVIRFNVEAEDLSGVYFKVTDGEKYSILDPYSDGNGNYRVDFKGVTADKMRSAFMITAYDGNGNAVSDTVAYSVETYAKAMLDDADLGSLIRAMMLYGDSAAAYASSAN